MATTNSEDEKGAADAGAEKAESAEAKGEATKDVEPKAKAEAKEEAKAEAEAKAETKDAAEDDDEPKEEAKPKPASRPAARPAGPRPAAPRAAGGGAGGLVPIALVVGVAVVLGYVVLRSDGGSGGPPAAPKVDESAKWTVGQVVELDVTLKPTDRANLSCSSPEEVAGKHCAFDAPDKPSAKGTDDDKKLLKPYAVPNSATRILAAGLWTDAGMSGTLPDARFTVHCKFTLEGKVSSPGVRWDPKGPWRDMKSPWFTATASSCAIRGK